jgi:hypothetical protein
MIKIVLVGNNKDVLRLKEQVIKTQKFEIVGTYEIENTDWLSAYSCEEFDNLLTLTDAVVFSDSTTQFLALAEKTIYKLKHIFTESIRVEHANKLREIYSLCQEASIVFHVGNQLSVSPAFLCIWPYLKKVAWFDLHIKMPFNSKNTFENLVYQSIDLSLKTVNCRIERLRKNGSFLFNDEIPDHFFIWLESSSGAIGRINFSYHSEKEINATFATADRLFEMDVLNHKVWEFKKAEQEYENGALFNEQNNVKLQQDLPKINKVSKQVIYFDSLSKELFNFWDNITNKLTPLTGIHELLEVTQICENILPTETTPNSVSS